MINSFYKNFKIRDYMGEEDFYKNRKTIDCSLGTNPFVKGGYIDPSYNKLKKYIKNAIKEDMKLDINYSNISFSSRYNGGN